MGKKRKMGPKAEPESKLEPEVEETVIAEEEEAPATEEPANGDASGAAEAEEEEEAEVEAEVKGGDDEDDDEEDGSDEEDDSDDVRKLLEPFGKDQIIDLLCGAAEKHPDVVDRVNKIADLDPAHRKIFVHGLGWDTTGETLTDFFNKYGEIEDCNCVTDKATGKSKGYGFILFKHRSSARKALKQPQKKIGSRMTACQLASAGPVPATPPVSEYTQRKIYVSNVSAEIDPQRLLQFFSKYGEIEEGPLGLDKQTGRPKGFALFVYKMPESAKKALDDPHKNFEGHALHCQKAIDGPKPGRSHFHHPGASQPKGGAFLHGNAPSGSAAGGSHLIGGGLGFNQAAAAATNPTPLNPALGQALTALLASQGAGLGLTNMLASLSPALGANLSSAVNLTVPTPFVGNASHGAAMGGYGNQPGVNANLYGNQGGLPYQGVRQPSGGRSQQPGGPMGGVPPYMGH